VGYLEGGRIKKGRRRVRRECGAITNPERRRCRTNGVIKGKGGGNRGGWRRLGGLIKCRGGKGVRVGEGMDRARGGKWEGGAGKERSC